METLYFDKYEEYECMSCIKCNRFDELMFFIIINSYEFTEEEIEILKLLLKNVANVNWRNIYGLHSLETAITDKNINMIKLLLKMEQMYMEIVSSCYYSGKIIELLLKYGANVNIKCRDGRKMLHYLITSGKRNDIEIWGRSEYKK